MKSLMPSKKTWVSDDGVIEIEMISYRTVLVDRLRDQFRVYWDKQGDLDESLARFVLCLASTTSVKLLVDEPPMWARIIYEMFEQGAWKREAVKVYESLDFAPSEVILYWYIAYLRTRDDSLLAPEPLQNPAPLPPEAYALEGEGDPVKLNFTESAMTNGGENLIVMSSPAPVKRSTGPTRKAK